MSPLAASETCAPPGSLSSSAFAAYIDAFNRNDLGLRRLLFVIYELRGGKFWRIRSAEFRKITHP